MSSQEFEPNTVLEGKSGKYLLKKLIGTGGYGTVYKARVVEYNVAGVLEVGNIVAVKI